MTGPIAHGGDLDAARRRFPHAPEPWLDLSTGINPLPYPVPPLSSEMWTRLPQADAERALQLAATHAFGAADPVMIVSAPGTQALIQLLPALQRSSSRVAVVGPTYAEHARSWARAGHDVHHVATLGHAHDADVVVIVNPDNPTGRLNPRPELERCARAVVQRGGLLVIDEAFVDVLDPNASVVPDLPPATAVLRSFGKSYGLAGLRLGFAVAAPPLAERLRDLLGPWAVAGPALEIGRRALADTDWLADTRRRLTQDSGRLDDLLTAAGCRLLGGTPLFRLVAHDAAAQLAGRLGAHAIHVRCFAHEPAWLRFGLPGHADDWRRLSTALAAR